MGRLTRLLNSRIKVFKSSEYRAEIGFRLARYSRLTLAFVPGLILLGMGICVFIVPQLFVAALAAFFIFMGMLACVLTWRFLALKRKVEATLRGLEAKVYVQRQAQEKSSGMPSFDELLAFDSDKKDIILH